MNRKLNMIFAQYFLLIQYHCVSWTRDGLFYPAVQNQHAVNVATLVKSNCLFCCASYSKTDCWALSTSVRNASILVLCTSYLKSNCSKNNWFLNECLFLQYCDLLHYTNRTFGSYVQWKSIYSARNSSTGAAWEWTTGQHKGLCALTSPGCAVWVLILACRTL